MRNLACLLIGLLLSLPIWGQVELDVDPTLSLGWKLQFADNFNRPQIGEDWQVISGTWTIKDGKLHGQRPVIVTAWTFTGSVRVEFDAIAHDPAFSDLSAILDTKPDTGATIDGYFFGFGAEGNKTSKLLIHDSEVERNDLRVELGKRYRVVCQREGNRLTHIIDGKVVASVELKQPIPAGRRAVALYTYNGGMFDDVRIYTKDGAARPPVKVSTPLAAPMRAAQESYRIDDPLFEELFGDTPAPDRFPVYGSDKMDARPKNNLFVRAIRATAKRFGARYVHQEMLDLVAERGYVPYGKQSYPDNKSRGINTWSRSVEPPPANSLISLPDDSLPLVYGTRGWLLDPRYLDYLVTEWEQRAKDNEQWGIPQFDEIWTYYTIKPVPRDKWYKQVEEADREVREKYGFGKFGIPLTHKDGDPFDRIAHGRWASDRLTDVFARIHKAVKAINPDMKIIGPTHGSSATSADMEAWGPYFDIMGGQCAGGASDNLIDLMRPGCVTKLYVDLAQCPIWIMLHMSKDHAKRRDPEYIREVYSQVFRNGGHGIWMMSGEFFEAELADSEFCEPAKWRCIMQVTDMIRNMRLPRLPEADCAILFSSNSTYTTMWGGLSDNNDRIISAYAVAGPALQSWPRFVSDRQIERGDINLADYKLLYIPYNAYGTPELLGRVKDYVRGGGTVICTDTDAFTWNINGEKFGEAWTKFVGVRKTDPREDPAIMRTATGHLTALTPGYNIELLNDQVETIAKFADGSPAVTVNTVGKGRIYFFAADPFVSVGINKAKKSTVAKDSPIVKWAQTIHRQAGVKMGRDIWRFKLPPYKGDVYQKQQGVCLTNNYVYDANEPLLEPNNLDTGGNYTYNRAPTGIADKGGAGEAISFATGHLTNRLEAFKTRNRRDWRSRSKAALDKVTANWVVQWRGTEPIHITFDLGAKRNVSRVRLFYSGDAKSMRVSDESGVKLDEKRFDTPVGDDVVDVTLPAKSNMQQLRLDITPGQTFQLSEVEIWGE